MSEACDRFCALAERLPLCAGEQEVKVTGPSVPGGDPVPLRRTDVSPSQGLPTTTSTTLVEVAPGTAVVFGEIPHGLELIDFGLIPPDDRVRLSTALAAIGHTATFAGNAANAAAAARGLYRLTQPTIDLLKSSGQLAVKDGANLGAILRNGQVVAQARFVPVGMTAAGVAVTLGPALAMIGLQMQLSEISGLVRTNIALTTQTLKAIRHEQWAEVTGLVDTIDRAIKDATEIQAVTESLWEHVAGTVRRCASNSICTGAMSMTMSGN